MKRNRKHPQGESIEIDKGIKYHVYWLNNNILIKEK